VSPYVRTVKTASGARAVQIVYSSRRGSRDIEHVGSAHDDAELEVSKAAARQRLAAGQGELDLGLASAGSNTNGDGPLPIYHLLAGGHSVRRRQPWVGSADVEDGRRRVVRLACGRGVEVQREVASRSVYGVWPSDLFAVAAASLDSRRCHGVVRTGEWGAFPSDGCIR
jgi:hypothetical protein